MSAWKLTARLPGFTAWAPRAMSSSPAAASRPCGTTATADSRFVRPKGAVLQVTTPVRMTGSGFVGLGDPHQCFGQRFDSAQLHSPLSGLQWFRRGMRRVTEACSVRANP
jgi:hypothetical protein